MGLCQSTHVPSAPQTPTESVDFLVQLQGGGGVPKGFSSSISDNLSKPSLTKALSQLLDADVDHREEIMNRNSTS
eukprot:symbB.v1.2.013881.t1/scaffold991.1/size149480/16